MVSADDLTLDDLDAIYPRRQLDNEKANRLKRMAVRFTNDVFGDLVARLPEVEGDADDFTVLVWAHLVELRAGGEAASENQTGGSVSYTHLQGNIDASLSETRYGRMARTYMREEQSIGIVTGEANFDY
jgi:hypothetical protein